MKRYKEKDHEGHPVEEILRWDLGRREVVKQVDNRERADSYRQKKKNDLCKGNRRAKWHREFRAYDTV